MYGNLTIRMVRIRIAARRRWYLVDSNYVGRP